MTLHKFIRTKYPEIYTEFLEHIKTTRREYQRIWFNKNFVRRQHDAPKETKKKTTK